MGPSRNKLATKLPISRAKLCYGRQWIEEDDIQAVSDVLRSDWLTTGPSIDAFEQAVAAFTGAKHAVAVSSGTAALHAAMFAIGIRAGDEVIVPPITFAATANAVVYQGGTPVFADVDPSTLLINPFAIEKKITPHTKAIVAVDFAGQPCDYDALRHIAKSRGLFLIADAAHALGASYKKRRVGTLADLTTFSFHPVKHITTGEGGMIVTGDRALARRMRIFRNHGITTDSRRRNEIGSWYYEMVDLGYNYRISDFQCALGVSQLKKLPRWLTRRRQIAARYDASFMPKPSVRPLAVRPDVAHAYHLYVVRTEKERILAALRSHGIAAGVHYIPVYLHPFYQRRFGTAPGLCPVAETAFKQVLSLPIFPKMSDKDVDTVIAVIEEFS